MDPSPIRRPHSRGTMLHPQHPFQSLLFCLLFQMPTNRLPVASNRCGPRRTHVGYRRNVKCAVIDLPVRPPFFKSESVF